jgi:hypothetical protein
MADNSLHNELIGFDKGSFKASGIVDRPRNIADVMNNLSIRVQEEVRDQIIKADFQGNDNLLQSVSMPVTIFGSQFIATLYLTDYYDYINKGVTGIAEAGEKRKSGVNKGKAWQIKTPRSNTPYHFVNGPPVSAIKRYSLNKGLNPFAVRQSIAMQGIRASKFFDKAFDEITEGMIYANLLSDLRSAGQTALTEGIKNIFKKGGKK